MDATKGELRGLVMAEKDSLLQQVELARLRLEDASEYRRRVVENPLPSVKDMRELEHKLEKMSVAPQSALLDLMQNVSAAGLAAEQPLLRESPKKARQMRSSVSPSPGVCPSPGAGGEHTPTPPPGPPKRSKKPREDEGGTQGKKREDGEEGALSAKAPGKRQHRTQMAMSIDCAGVRKAPADPACG